MAEMTIRRFGVISVAKMYSLLMFIFGLIFGVIYGLILIVFGAAISALTPGSDARAGGISTVVMGIAMMIGLPLGSMPETTPTWPPRLPRVSTAMAPTFGSEMRRP